MSVLRGEGIRVGELIDPVPFVEAWIELALVIDRCGRASGRGYDGKIRGIRIGAHQALGSTVFFDVALRRVSARVRPASLGEASSGKAAAAGSSCVPAPILVHAVEGVPEGDCAAPLLREWTPLAGGALLTL